MTFFCDYTMYENIIAQLNLQVAASYQYLKQLSIISAPSALELSDDLLAVCTLAHELALTEINLEIVHDYIIEQSKNIAAIHEKRILKILDDGEIVVQLEEFDHLYAFMDNLLAIGRLFPLIDFQVMSSLGFILATIIKTYSGQINAKLETIKEKIDEKSLVLAIAKGNLLESLRVSAFRFRSFSNHFLDLISLQSAFQVPEAETLKDLISNLEKEGFSGCFLKCDQPLLIFLSPDLSSDHEKLTDFIKGNVNTSEKYSSSALFSIPVSNCDRFSGCHLDFDSALALYFCKLDRHIYLVTRSVLTRRLLENKIFAGKPFSRVPDFLPFSTVDLKRVNFLLLHGLIKDEIANLCLQLSDVLCTMSYDDKQMLDAAGLHEEVNQSVYITLGYTFQFLLDASYPLEKLQFVFEDQGARTLFWLGLHLDRYGKGDDYEWTVLSLMKVLDHLNSFVRLDVFKKPEKWNPFIYTIEKHLETVQAMTLTDFMDGSAHLQIVDQTILLLEHFGKHIVNQTHVISESKHKLAKQSLFKSKNLLVFSRTSESKSEIYQCLDLLTRKLVVVKRISRKYIIDGTLSEIDYMMMLKHSNIVQYISHFEDDDHLFFVMEFCEGKLFVKGSERVKSENYVRSVCRQLLLGLSYLHSNHVVHRDIKPDNVLVTGEGVVKIADFGEAHLRTGSPSNDKFDFEDLHGTPYYMAPECLVQRIVTDSVDMWSFGCLLAKLLTNIDPWSHCPRQFNVLYMLGTTSDIPYDLSSLDCSEEAKAILSTIFDRDPLQRPSAASLLGNSYFSSITETLY